MVRFQAFARGEWIQLLRASAVCDEKATRRRHRQRRTRGDDIANRVARIERLVVGLSRVLQWLQGTGPHPTC